MALHLYDTLSGEKKPFRTMEPNKARLYVCGPTVYDFAHVGHARCYVTYDVLVRHLRESGLDVTYVRNVTDVDDKILKRSAENGESPRELSERYTVHYREDMARLGNVEPTIEPKVSEHIPEIIALIEKLVAKDAAYASNGDVYFRVKAFPEYGKLSHRKVADLELGASGRTSESEESRKEHAADFALWKGAKEGEQGWQSPWGFGRPGWHIECSAMSMRYLGESFDLHAGGLDLVFPHHENEIAQAEAATGCTYAHHWMHNGFIETNKEKMSKSLGNFFTVREVFEHAEPEAMRWFCLSVHYRSPLGFDWSLDEGSRVNGFPQIEEAERRVEYLYNTQQRLRQLAPERIVDSNEKVPDEVAHFPKKLRDSLNDDLNVPMGLAATFEFLKSVNELVDRASRKKGTLGVNVVTQVERGFDALSKSLGFGGDDAAAFLGRIRARRVKKRGLTEAAIEAKIASRIEARASKDFARSDAIRDELVALGIELMDGAAGTEWRAL